MKPLKGQKSFNTSNAIGVYDSSMREMNIVSAKHNSISRDYLARVNDLEFPKHRAAELAKKWDFDYWDGDRRICYGGYTYRPGYWTPIAEKLIENYGLTQDSKVIDIGCGKGFLLFELHKVLPGIQVYGLDISDYAIKHAPWEVSDQIILGTAEELPFKAVEFDLAFSINTFHNLEIFNLCSALKEIKRVSKQSYVVVESYRNEIEKENLLYWQVTCESFFNPSEWKWIFDFTEYDRDYEFIYFS